MAKKVKANKQQSNNGTQNAKVKKRVKGEFTEGSTISNLFEALRNGKPKDVKSLGKLVAEKGVSVQNRLYRLNARGVRTGKWRLERKGNIVRMVIKAKKLKQAA